MYLLMDKSLNTTMSNGLNFLGSIISGYTTAMQCLPPMEYDRFEDTVATLTQLFYEIPLPEIREIIKAGTLFQFIPFVNRATTMYWDVFDVAWLVSDKIRTIPIINSITSYEYIYHSPL